MLGKTSSVTSYMILIECQSMLAACVWQAADLQDQKVAATYHTRRYLTTGAFKHNSASLYSCMSSKTLHHSLLDLV